MSSKGGSSRNRRTYNFITDQHRQKGRSSSNHAPTIQTSNSRMCDSKRTSSQTIDDGRTWFEGGGGVALVIVIS